MYLLLDDTQDGLEVEKLSKRERGGSSLNFREEEMDEERGRGEEILFPYFSFPSSKEEKERLGKMERAKTEKEEKEEEEKEKEEKEEERERGRMILLP